MPDLDQHRTPRTLWIAAAIVALMLHLGGAALALVHLKGAELDGGLGASGVEIAIELASPKVEDNDLPAGADSSAAEASPQRAEQTAEVKQENLPRDRPDQVAEADRSVTPNETRPEEQQEQKVAAVKTEASVESQASQESARKALDVDAPVAERAKAPNAGLGADAQKLTADWGRRISAWFEKHKRYPEGRSGNARAKVAFVLNRTGKVLSSSIVSSAGDAAFDQAALDMIRRSDPVPPPPAGLTDDQFSFSIEVNFTPAGSKVAKRAK